jgi:hypothetical protein
MPTRHHMSKGLYYCLPGQIIFNVINNFSGYFTPFSYEIREHKRQLYRKWISYFYKSIIIGHKLKKIAVGVMYIGFSFI